ncbi:TetR/AcrR family transcriptional regulator [Evansella tamaricis]|uniref:TetR family transcriptional regulator C-terminal domain-containing protein n=1 Tax=Evansella tamaricis TaxID=2069301 RepID=A0ABS6JC05_9BACI|nr:TetR-like C-terminal domain-containing protein [Evansella tamaricis]MBU9711208.1 TetR family transcriptional regulator C-terminal domain-containing protein [Evansella tamaricis]
MNEKDLRVIKTKNSLETAMMELLRDKPLEKITVTDLCKRSGITRKTFYLHYENVPKYFEEFVCQLLDEMEESLQKATEHHLQSEKLEPQMIHIFEHVYRNKEFYQFIFNSQSTFTYYELFFERIRSIFLHSIESTAEHDELTRYEIAYHSNAILGIIYEWYQEGFQKSVDEMNHLLIKILRV